MKLPGGVERLGLENVNRLRRLGYQMAEDPVLIPRPLLHPAVELVLHIERRYRDVDISSVLISLT
ncbi:hypothetical protein [Arthrobacter sp. 4R501]|uniref:hypothetical protein n=1 Tax=Arthrobacter sp. 4R501 TaxID=2058886 RepID=UPI0011B00110|nr:hypothetical protein [Arthrobacter sp. 4R501]